MTEILGKTRLRDKWTAWNLKNRFKAEIQEFQENEDGAILPLVLFAFVLMITVAGFGIDVMRHEMERTHLQATLDASVLAGAGAPAGSTADDVQLIVEDYFVKSDIADYLNEIEEGDIQVTLNRSSVTASADVTLDTYFMKFAGVNTLAAASASTAEKFIPQLEIAMVLDVSGSMQINNRLVNLQAAAKQFTTNILSSAEQGSAAISIVPFNHNVTPGTNLYGTLAVNEAHQNSNCLHFDAPDFSQTDITTKQSNSLGRPKSNQEPYTALYGAFDNLQPEWITCTADDNYQILPYSMSDEDLHAKINSMAPLGATATNVGVKWGAALLDQSFSYVSSELNLLGDVDNRITDKPRAFDDPDTLKAMVVMGDGQNIPTYGFPLDSQFLHGDSKLHRVEYQEETFLYATYIYNAAYRYYGAQWEYLCSYPQWFSCEYEAGSLQTQYYLERFDGRYIEADGSAIITAAEFNNLSATLSGFKNSINLSWPEAWSKISVQQYSRKTGHWTPYFAYFAGVHSSAQKNAEMQQACSAAKSRGVIIYTIGYEIAEGGTAETNLRDCASSPAHYFRAEGVNINNAFSAIATNVQNLRLTQ